MAEGFRFDDGGRADAGFKGRTGDCVCRSVAIASGRPYKEIYDRLARGNAAQRTSGGRVRGRTARNGIAVKRKWFKDYMAELGFEWTPTMRIGSGCKVHLCAEELPAGRLVVAVSGHYTAMIDGVVHDTHDPRREAHCTEPYREPMPAGYWTHDKEFMHHVARRCVYGYWTLGSAAR